MGELSDFGQHTPLLIVAVSVDTGLEVWRGNCGYTEGFGLELAYSDDMGILVAGADWGCTEPAGEIFVHNARTGALLEDRSINASVREVKIVDSLSLIVADVTVWSYEENQGRPETEEVIFVQSIEVERRPVELFQVRVVGCVTDATILHGRYLCWVTLKGCVTLADIDSGVQRIYCELGTCGTWSFGWLSSSMSSKQAEPPSQHVWNDDAVIQFLEASLDVIKHCRERDAAAAMMLRWTRAKPFMPENYREPLRKLFSDRFSIALV